MFAMSNTFISSCMPLLEVAVNWLKFDVRLVEYYSIEYQIDLLLLI